MSRPNTLTLITTCLCLIALTAPVCAQQRLAGRLDSNRPTPAIAPEGTEAAINAATTFAGSWVFKVTITIKSTLPTSDAIACTATASVFDSNPNPPFNVFTSYDEVASVQATRSGSTATCTVTIPYSWSLDFASTDTVALDFAISVPGFFISTTNALPNRVHDHSLPSHKVVSGGATFTLSETI